MKEIEITLSVPMKLFHRAQRMASLTQRQVSEVLVEAIRFDEIDEDEAADEQAVAQERAAFVALHGMLVEKYLGEHVAIYKGQLIDHDTDGAALSLRIYQQFPEDFVWIAPVTDQPSEEWVVRSPRFEPAVS